MTPATPPPPDEIRRRRLLNAARAGDETAFAQLVDEHRGELHAHCYRMLGSVQDAEDALQEALLRAWRGLPRFEGRSTLRSWLYSIVTNACLTTIERRPRRMLPLEHGPPTDPTVSPGDPVAEPIWLEPYPEAELALAAAAPSPEARYEVRESVELAFIAALQHLPATQRAVLILRDVLAFSAREVAETLDTSVASVNSALQRARTAVSERVPERSQQATLRALGDGEVRRLVGRYVEAWERCDVAGFAAMLSAEATFAMPPLASWYRGREDIARWAAAWPLSGAWRWRALLTQACAQPALGFYAWNDQDGAFRPFALNVLSFQGREVAAVTAFIARAATPRDREVFTRYPDEPVDARGFTTLFERFGLPATAAATS